MTRRIIMLVLALAAVPGLSACGSSAPKSAAAQTTTISLGSPSAAATTPAASGAKSNTAGSTATRRSSSAGAAVAASKIRKVTKPTPSNCLAAAGLLNPHVVSKGETAALSGAVGEDVFVEGPYKTKAAAASAAASLYGVESAASGGKYSVSAVLRAHLGAKVKAVAACLRGAKARGFLTF